MKSYHYATTTELAPERLYRAITDISRWPEWDNEIEATAHDGRLEPGTPFMLKPRGGPKVSMEIAAAEAPHCFIDISHLPLAKMRTTHRFTPGAEGTRVEVAIDIWGPLGFLWDRVVARKMAAGAAGQTRLFLEFARRLT